MEFAGQTPQASPRVRTPRHVPRPARRPVRPGGVDVTEGLARLAQDPSRRQRPVRVTPQDAAQAAEGQRHPARHRGIDRARSPRTVVRRGSPLRTARRRSPRKPALELSMTSGRTIGVPGSAPAIPWTSAGQSAVAVPGAGLLETSGAETPQPIASLTKMMTAYLTLDGAPAHRHVTWAEVRPSPRPTSRSTTSTRPRTRHPSTCKPARCSPSASCCRA